MDYIMDYIICDWCNETVYDTYTVGISPESGLEYCVCDHCVPDFQKYYKMTFCDLCDYMVTDEQGDATRNGNHALCEQDYEDEQIRLLTEGILARYDEEAVRTALGNGFDINAHTRALRRLRNLKRNADEFLNGALNEVQKRALSQAEDEVVTTHPILFLTEEEDEKWFT